MPTYTYRTWRVFVVLTAIPGLLTSMLYCFFPESPKFLLSRGKEQECIAILQRIYSVNTGKSPETYPVKRVLLAESLEVVDKVKKTKGSFVETMKTVGRQTLPLFRPPHILHTVICFIMMMSFFGVSVYSILTIVYSRWHA
uniref:Uncharacterized protein n=1 Tax=Timema douglasi TaxID=61478 RepID=A0A7R8VYK0_TIMDO|nr:unnamed protein product [Timema douglasi]